MKSNLWSSSRELLVGKDGKHDLPLSPSSPILLRRFHFPPDYRITLNHHDFFEISMVREGRGFFWNMGKRTRVQAGDAFIVGDHQFHTLEPDLASPMKMLCVFFLPDCIYRPGGSPVDFELVRPFFHSSVCLKSFLPGKIERGGMVMRDFENLESILSSQKPLFIQRAKIALAGILLSVALCFRRSAAAQKIRPPRRTRDIQRLQPVFDFLQARLSYRIELRQAADLAGMTPAYFCRFFRQVTGTRLMEYLTRLRIDRARELLLQGDLSITQVALETGFEHLSYFDRIFHRYVHMSPQEFSRRYSG